MKYMIKLADSNQNTCLINLSLPFFKRLTKPDNSNWEAKTEGMLKHRLGGCFAYTDELKEEWWEPVKHAHEGNLALCAEGKGMLLLYKFFDTLSITNGSGNGAVIQEMCIGFKCGEFTWILIE